VVLWLSNCYSKRVTVELSNDRCGGPSISRLDEMSPPKDSTRSATVAREPQIRILLIDDEEELASVISQFFVDRGYSVEYASESEEAIAMIRHHRFDIAVVDLELNSIEGLDGFRVLKALRQSCPMAPAIVYSGHFGKSITEAALRHGGTRFIAKPASLPQLLACVEELCPQPS